MPTLQQLQHGWARAPAQPRDGGTLRRVVRRLGGGVHETIERGTLSVEQGLVGDRWYASAKRSLERQLTLMNARVAELVAGGRPDPLPGDNLLVDLDLSARAAPPGTRLQIGRCIIEITATPHTGCAKFRERFGAEALAWIADRTHPADPLRGVNGRVIEGGTVAVGDRIAVLR